MCASEPADGRRRQGRATGPKWENHIRSSVLSQFSRRITREPRADRRVRTPDPPGCVSLVLPRSHARSPVRILFVVCVLMRPHGRICKSRFLIPRSIPPRKAISGREQQSHDSEPPRHRTNFQITTIKRPTGARRAVGISMRFGTLLSDAGRPQECGRAARRARRVVHETLRPSPAGLQPREARSPQGLLWTYRGPWRYTAPAWPASPAVSPARRAIWI